MHDSFTTDSYSMHVCQYVQECVVAHQVLISIEGLSQPDQCTLLVVCVAERQSSSAWEVEVQDAGGGLRFWLEAKSKPNRRWTSAQAGIPLPPL